MDMDDRALRRSYRNAWILTLVAAIFVVAFFVFTLRRNTPPRPETWDMGGAAFVPASSPEADGYPVLPDPGLAPRANKGRR